MPDSTNPKSTKFGFDDPQQQNSDVELIVHADEDKVLDDPKKQIAIAKADRELKLSHTTFNSSTKTPVLAKSVNYDQVAGAALVGCGLTLALMFQIDNQSLLLSSFALLIFAVARLHVILGQATGQFYRFKAKRTVSYLAAGFVLPVVVIALLASFPQITRSLVMMLPSLISIWDGGQSLLKYVVVAPFLIFASLWLCEAVVLTNVNQPAKEEPGSKLFFPVILLCGVALNFSGTMLWHSGVIAMLNLGFGFQFLSIILLCDTLKAISPEKLMARAIRMRQPKLSKVANTKHR